jgi:hypothetical protein
MPGQPPPQPPPQGRWNPPPQPPGQKPELLAEALLDALAPPKPLAAAAALAAAADDAFATGSEATTRAKTSNAARAYATIFPKFIVSSPTIADQYRMIKKAGIEYSKNAIIHSSLRLKKRQ